MTALIITCTRCLRNYEPTREDILKGIKYWQLRPDCRQLEPPPDTELNRKES